MKKSLLLLTIVLSGFLAQAQSIESIKTMLTLRQYSKAKTDLDKAWSNPKFTAKPEAYMLKASVYGGLSADAAVKGTPTGDQYATEADAAFMKYKELDPALPLINDPVYQDGPINIYSSLFSSGYKDYDAKNWQAGFQKFKRVVEYSDLLIAKKIINIPADTNSLLLAGITAESAGLKDEAVKYYGRIADLKVGGAGFEGIYRYLVNYYATKKDDANFEKYRSIGKGLYPSSEFFSYDKVDFAVGLESDFNKRVGALEETITKDPTNYKAAEMLGEIIYDTLYSSKEGNVPPANAAELETKMVSAFTKAGSLKPEDEMPWIYIGQNYMIKRDRINDAREKHAADMKTRTKPGTPASKDDVAKREALDAQYAQAFMAAEEPFKKAADIFDKKPKPLTGGEIQRYKNIAGYLGDIATYKKNKSKGNAADVAKYTAEEKKWNDLYDEIGKMKPKPKE